MTHPIKSPKKLIEVALPLDDINEAAAREKSIRHGHPSTLHLWWARRPLAAARAVIFAQMVNDPGYQREIGFGVNKKEAEIKREKLFQIIRDLVKWENTNNEEVLQRARDAIWESWRETCRLNRSHPQAEELFNPEKLPAFHDPFAGGGALPLEAQRLGLESYASDLNPVAVMINKAMIEFPPRFAGRVPIGPIPEADRLNNRTATTDMHQDWIGATGMAEDVRRYGHWIREEAFKRIGHLYPKIKVTKEMVAERPDLAVYEGEELTVIAWLWVRTVKSPNPMFSHVDVPLASSFVLSSKAGKEAWIEPIIEGDSYEFKIRVSSPPSDAKNGTKAARGANFTCLLSGSLISKEYIQQQGASGNISNKLMAIVVEGNRGRVYLPASIEQKRKNDICEEYGFTSFEFSKNSRHMTPWIYGLSEISDLYTRRQLTSINVFSKLIDEVYTDIIDKHKDIDYAKAITVYLAFVVSKLVDINNALAPWGHIQECPLHLFSRQAISMIWDFSEANPLSNSSGSWKVVLNGVLKGMASIVEGAQLKHPGIANHMDASKQNYSNSKVVSTDPPYYDNVPYADLSDFFYMWLRTILKSKYPDIFSTIATPKNEELVADAFRHESQKAADAFFMTGMREAMTRISENVHPAFPTTIYYAFKQSETKVTGTVSAGWVAFIEAVIQSGFTISGTWPMKTERGARMRGQESNALASSIILVCHKKKSSAATITRREFQRELRSEMPEALETMIGGESGYTPIAPVDLAQAAIGPGMAIYSKYSAILNQDGSSLSVHDALIMINQAISDYLNPDGGSSDADTLFCSAWFEQYGWSTGNFGDADILARAKGTSVDGVKEAGIIESSGGKVRLLKWSEYPTDYDPKTDKRNPVWEACHHMIRVLQTQGETAAGQLLARMPELGEAVRQLAYHLYTLCERKNWAEEARAYNELIGSWSAINDASHEVGHVHEQGSLAL